MLNNIKMDNRPYKAFLYSLLFGTLILLSIMLRNLFILGASNIEALYLPSYSAARTIRIGDFISRIEGSVSLNFVFTGLTKMTVCIIAATNGFRKLLNSRNSKMYVVPVCLLVLAICPYTYLNAIEMFTFIDKYEHYAFPFQVVIPIIIWAGAEFKNLKQKKTADVKA